MAAQPARYYDGLAERAVRCRLCPRQCQVTAGGRGFCRARENRAGKYYTLVYSNPCSLHIDPIEKKPLFHFHPATTALSVAMAGCNFSCKNCQNWDISQSRPDDTYNLEVTPEEMAELAIENGNRTIAYTYTEPSIFFEYVLDTSKAARRRGVKNIIKSNGYLNPDPLNELIPVLDAANIDLKGYSEDFYRDLTGGTMAPVLATIQRLNEAGVWLEITNLVIPGKNDSPDMIEGLCRWIVDTLGHDVPLHFSRFYPQYQLPNVPPTPAATLLRAAETARAAGITYVYIGNVPELSQESTVCPKCGRVLVERRGYDILQYHVSDGACAYCRKTIPGRWS
jgi:pyruvate formate lyase activating enzyme